MLFHVPEVDDADSPREVLAEEIFQPSAAVADGNLLLGLIPAHMSGLSPQLQTQFVQVIKACQIPRPLSDLRT
jgi:hypothetical protein